MTKTDIEKLINFIDDNIHEIFMKGECYVGQEPDEDGGKPIWCKLPALYKLLRECPVGSDKTCGPDYKAMYERNAMELDKAQQTVNSLKFDLHNLSVEHAHYVGAVAAMETIFGRKFEPKE